MRASVESLRQKENNIYLYLMKVPRCSNSSTRTQWRVANLWDHSAADEIYVHVTRVTKFLFSDHWTEDAKSPNTPRKHITVKMQEAETSASHYQPHGDRGGIYPASQSPRREGPQWRQINILNVIICALRRGKKKQQLVLVCYCGKCVISNRVTLRNLVRDMIDGATVVDVEADGEESRRSRPKVTDGEWRTMWRHRRTKEMHEDGSRHRRVPVASKSRRMAGEDGRDRTCDVVLFERVAVDLVLVGTVLLQPFAHILLSPQGHWFGQLHITWLWWKNTTNEGMVDECSNLDSKKGCGLWKQSRDTFKQWTTVIIMHHKKPRALCTSLTMVPCPETRVLLTPTQVSELYYGIEILQAAEYQWKNLYLLEFCGKYKTRLHRWAPPGVPLTGTATCLRFAGFCFISNKRAHAAAPAPRTGPSAGISTLLEANLLALMWKGHSEEAPRPEQLLWATHTIS